MTVFTIEPVTVPAGDTVAMQFEFINDNGTIPNLSEYTGYYVLSYYGFEDENVLSVEMALVENTTNIFSVTLYSDDTINLEEGVYTVKIVLSDGSNYFKKARGVLNILKDSDSVEVGE